MTEEGAAELYKHRDDPDEWDDQPVEIDVRPGAAKWCHSGFPQMNLTASPRQLEWRARACHSSYGAH